MNFGEVVGSFFTKLVFLEKMKNTLDKAQQNLKQNLICIGKNIDSEESPLTIHTTNIIFFGPKC